jgi:hypothetical protein
MRMFDQKFFVEIFQIYIFVKGHNLIKIISQLPPTYCYVSAPTLGNISKGEQVKYLILHRFKTVLTSSKMVRSTFCVSECLLSISWREQVNFK